jgi:hypothetical protein
MSAIRTRVTPLGDRHVKITVTASLCIISKALKVKAENRLVAVYAGFDNGEAAHRFAAWVQVNWDKTPFEVVLREGQRTQSAWEVKVRRPTEPQLQALVKKATAPAKPQGSSQPTHLRPASHDIEDWSAVYGTCGPVSPTRVVVGNRTVCID